MSKPADATSESGLQGHEPAADRPGSGATVVLRRSDLRGRHLLATPFALRRNRPLHRRRRHCRAIATKHDVEILRVLFNSGKFRRRYDPMKRDSQQRYASARRHAQG